MILSRGGLELSDVWKRQRTAIVEMDAATQSLQRAVHADPGDHALRDRLVQTLRRAGNHTEADQHELTPIVRRYQQAHSNLTRLARKHHVQGKFSEEERGEALHALINREDHLRQAVGMAHRHLKIRAGSDEHRPMVHEVGEHIARHLNRTHSLDNHDLTAQVLDVHHPFATRAGAYGRSVDHGDFLNDLHRRKRKEPHPLGGEDASRRERYQWSHERHNGEGTEAHGEHPGVEALKRSLTRTGAGSVVYHQAEIQDSHWRHSRSFHAFHVAPSEEGQEVKHVEPTVRDRRSDA